MEKILIIVILVIVLAGIFIYSNNQNMSGEIIKTKTPEITTPAGFINTPSTSSGQVGPITIGEFIGKNVILVDFWTYSCINCQRTTPYLNAWYTKYKDQGLIILGIHTPEFGFEKKYENVAKAVKQFKIEYPVILDNDYGTWNAFQNLYWPRKYLIDINGYIVYDHIGEGGYEETETKIQELLAERAKFLKTPENIAKDIVKPIDTDEVDFREPRSPEIYFGATRNLYLGNGTSGSVGAQELRQPTGIKTNILYLTGIWDFDKEFAENKSQDAKIIFRYKGKGVYMVGSANEKTEIEVFIDGELIDPEISGTDVLDGMLSIKEDRLYKIIESDRYEERTLELRIKRPGVKVFTFTFG